ncbi:calcineurin B-like protein 4 [Tanacetum coccineum]
MAQWKEAIKSEIDSILQNHTWELVDLLSGCKPLGYRWIFKKKMKVDGTIDKYKARLAIKGFKQQGNKQMVVDAVRDYITLMDNILTGIKEASELYKSNKTTAINDQREVKAVDDIDEDIKHSKLLSFIDMLSSTNHKAMAPKFILKDNELRGRLQSIVKPWRS